MNKLRVLKIVCVAVAGLAEILEDRVRHREIQEEVRKALELKGETDD